MEKRRPGEEKTWFLEEKGGDGEKERRNVEEKARGRKKAEINISWERIREEKATSLKDDEREIIKVKKIGRKTQKIRRRQDIIGQINQW